MWLDMLTYGLCHENQIVDINTVIGSVGGGELYDRCSPFSFRLFVARGIYAKIFSILRTLYC